MNIICSAEVTLDTIKELSAPEILFDDRDSNSICCGNEDTNYLAVTDIDADTADTGDANVDYKVIDMYKDQQKSELLKRFLSPKVFLVQFAGFDLLKEFLDKISSLNIFIDNDRGKLLTMYDLLTDKKYQGFINSWNAST